MVETRMVCWLMLGGRTLYAAAIALALFLSAGLARAGAFELNDAGWEGCAELLHLMREELGRERVIVAATLDWEKLKPTDGVLVLHPTQAIDAEEAAAFMKAGGRLAIVDDFGRGEKLLAHFKIHRRSLPSFPQRYLRGKPSLPLAFPAFDASGSEVLGLHPTVAEVKQVVLNHGTGLRHPDLTPVLEVRGPVERRSGRAETVAVAVAGQVDKGRLFAMGDPSAFINLMLRYPGNRKFAAGLVHYLADGDITEPRKGRLFILANAFGERGSFGGVTPLRKALDRKLRALVEAFEELRDQGFPWWLHVVVASLCALAILWWLTRAMLKLYRSRLPRFARATPLVAQGGVAGRVAVLSSSASPPALVLLELRSALVEALSYQLDMKDTAVAGKLIDELKRREGLEPELERSTMWVLGAMRAAERAIVGGTAPRVSRGQLGEASRVVGELLRRAGMKQA